MVSEEVVIVAAVSASETRVPIGGRKVPAIGSETKFGSESVASAGPDLDYAGDCIRSIERALRSADKFHASGLLEWESAKVKSAPRFIDGDAVHDDFVVAGFAATYEERCESTALSGGVDHGARQEADCVGGLGWLHSRELLGS